MKNFFTILSTITLFLFLSAIGFGQSGVGKLSGKVVDASSKEPLIGANIVILNTKLGATSNVKGEYFILNITPGTYDIQVTYVGYAKRIVKEVRLVANITYELDIELTTDFTLPEIVVEGKKFFEAKSTNTTKIIDAEDINNLPVKGVENLVSLNAGVVVREGSGGASGNAVINVRGGRGGEVLYIVDGVPQNSVFSGVNYSQVSNAAIDQISFQIGGYDAKYGDAQSGIVSVTTKTGASSYSLYVDALSSTLTDNYGYNLYTITLGGPFISTNPDHTFFLSGERGWFADGDPRTVGINFQTTGVSSNSLPNNESSIWRYTATTKHNLGDFIVRLGANINYRNFRLFDYDFAKNNSVHNPRVKRSNLSFDGKVSQNINTNTFWNLNLGYKVYNNVQGDGVWFDNLEAYGDSVANAKLGVTLPYNGGYVNFDDYGIFAKYGAIYDRNALIGAGSYRKTNISTMSADLDFTSQVSNHLLEVGGGFQYNILRYYSVFPVLLAGFSDTLSQAEKFTRLQPVDFGYDITGQNTTGKGSQFAPKFPIIAYGYAQDRFELSDMIINVGLRFDYFDTQADILKNPALPYAYGDPNIFDAPDFVKKKPEFYLSPRIGLGFPVTENTVFHAHYDRFVQQFTLDQLYPTIYGLNFLITDNNWNVYTGHVNSEVTTQYEIGFRQIIANKAAVNITAFYKNTQGLINVSTVFYQRSIGGQVLSYFTPTNTDFGTVKGLAISLDVSKISYFSLSCDYTLSYAEGTGSSTSSSWTAAFRNMNGEIPKVIAPLDFDQRHTGVINLNFSIPKGELGVFEMLNASLLFRFNSGRPYTPLQNQNLIAGFYDYGDTRGYVNSAYGPGNFSVDLKIEKTFILGGAEITPYLWIDNLFNADNPVYVYQSSGSPYTTGYLSTVEGQKTALSQNNPAAFIADYQAYEKNPLNFGIPREIKLGLKVNFAKIEF